MTRRRLFTWELRTAWITFICYHIVRNIRLIKGFIGAENLSSNSFYDSPYHIHYLFPEKVARCLCHSLIHQKFIDFGQLSKQFTVHVFPPILFLELLTFITASSWFWREYVGIEPT